MSVASLISDFIEDALCRYSDNDDRILWCRVDPVIRKGIGLIASDELDVTIRDNLDGPGEVKTYRIKIQEIDK